MKKISLSYAADWIMRIALAFIFILAGYGKLVTTGVDNFSTMLNIPLIFGWCATLGEIAAGIGIILGGFMKNKTGHLITRISGALIAFIMIVAFLMVKIKGLSPDFLKVCQDSSDVIALFAMGLYFTLIGNKNES